MSMYDWTIVVSGGRYWVYWRGQPKKDFATHKEAVRWLRAEARLNHDR
jgi:hypothetical protein